MLLLSSGRNYSPFSRLVLEFWNWLEIFAPRKFFVSYYSVYFNTIVFVVFYSCLGLLEKKAYVFYAFFSFVWPQGPQKQSPPKSLSAWFCETHFEMAYLSRFSSDFQCSCRLALKHNRMSCQSSKMYMRLSIMKFANI